MEVVASISECQRSCQTTYWLLQSFCQCRGEKYQYITYPSNNHYYQSVGIVSYTGWLKINRPLCL